MRDRPHRTLIGSMREAVEAWRKRERLSMAAVVQCIVETHERLGLDVATEITFDSDRDAHRRMQTNAERVFRWLDDVSKHNNHLPANFLPTLLASLPMDLRIQAADGWLMQAGLSVRELDGEAAPAALSTSLQSVAKESGEAVSAMAALMDGATLPELRAAQRELTEAIAAQESALHHVERLLVAGRRG